MERAILKFDMEGNHTVDYDDELTNNQVSMINFIVNESIGGLDNGRTYMICKNGWVNIEEEI